MPFKLWVSAPSRIVGSIQGTTVWGRTSEPPAVGRQFAESPRLACAARINRASSRASMSCGCSASHSAALLEVNRRRACSAELLSPPQSARDQGPEDDDSEARDEAQREPSTPARANRADAPQP